MKTDKEHRTMNQIKYLLIATMTMGVAMTSNAADYVIDKAGQHAYITFKASHLGFSYIIGHFEDFEGKFTYDAANPSASSASVTIKTNSLDSDHAERDKHLKGPEYFDADKYPEITFVSTGFEGDATSGKLKGNLTVHGVTKSTELDVDQIGEGKDPWGGYRNGFEGSVMLVAADFGLPAWIGDVEVVVIVEGVRQ